MTDPCKMLKVTQVGGFAGNLALPPLVDLDRDRLDADGRRRLDEACRQLAAAAAGAGGEIGADIASYVIEMSLGEGSAPHRFALPMTDGAKPAPDQSDVATIIAPLIGLAQTPG